MSTTIAEILSHYSALVRAGTVGANPADLVATPKRGRKLPRVLSREEMQGLIETARDLKLKLLEVYFMWGNKDAFREQMRDVALGSEQTIGGARFGQIKDHCRFAHAVDIFDVGHGRPAQRF